MKRWVPAASLLLVLSAAWAMAAAPEENLPPASPKASIPVISIKANLGGRNMEIEVDQTDDGMAARGTLDEQTITASGKRQPDGTVRVEVAKDQETMLEMTINPEALRQMTNPPTPEKSP